MRVYHCAPNRLPALNQRFETVTLDLWKKHGIEQVGFWTTLVGPSHNTLTYLLKWHNLAEREQKWNAHRRTHRELLPQPHRLLRHAIGPTPSAPFADAVRMPATRIRSSADGPALRNKRPRVPW